MGLRLPIELERVVRTASVAPHLRASFARLPGPIRLDARLPTDPERVPMAARQLLKLGLLDGPVRLRRVARSDRGPCQVTLTRDGRRCVLRAKDLAHDLRAVVEPLLAALLEPADVAALLDGFAFHASCLSTLRSIVERMLASTDVDEAHYLMLAGMTSGYGLGFNRAALFLFGEQAQVFRGVKAIGPFDLAEAHRIWEEIELEGMTIERLISDFETRRFDTRFQQHVQRLELRPSLHAEDELSMALGPTPPLRFERARPINAGLAALGAAHDFLLAVIRPHGRVLGLLFADDAYSSMPIDHERMQLARLFLDQGPALAAGQHPEQHRMREAVDRCAAERRAHHDFLAVEEHEVGVLGPGGGAGPVREQHASVLVGEVNAFRASRPGDPVAHERIARPELDPTGESRGLLPFGAISHHPGGRTLRLDDDELEAERPSRPTHGCEPQTVGR